MTTATQAKFRVLGTNDDASDCLCCGRQGLKSVVWLQPLDEDGEEDGAPVHFGRVCGARAAGWGYGSDRSRIDRRIAAEERKACDHYYAKARAVMAGLESSDAVVRTRVAFGFDWKQATYTYGHIFTLAGDPIGAIMDPVCQQAEIKNAKARLRAAHPIYRVCDERLTAAEMRALLASEVAQ